MSSPYTSNREDGRTGERLSGDTYSPLMASSRPGSAEIRPDLAAAPRQPWDMHRDRFLTASQQQLPGIHSILNDAPRAADSEQNMWNHSTNYPNERPHRYGSSMHSHSPPQSAISISSRTGYLAADARTDSIKSPHDRSGDLQPTLDRNLKRSFESADLTQRPDRRDDLRSPSSPVIKAEATTARSAMSPSMPHYVATKEIPGQVASYVYSDGSTCKSVVNGRPVKRELGVTKLGNPRKRQAEACIACRTKKIKCERVGPVRICAHCMKQNLDCRWARSSGQSPDPDADLQQTTESLDGGTAPGSSYGSRVSISPKQSPGPFTRLLSTAKDETSIDTYMEDRLRKRTLLASQDSDHDSFWALSRGRAVLSSNMSGDRGGVFGPSVDPFAANPEVAFQLLGLYFAYRDDHTATVFPCRSFIRWCAGCKSKTSADRMVLYAILALGSIFSTNVELKGASQELADIAKQLEQREFSRFTIQLAQARLHLTLYSWAKGFANHSFEYTDAGCRVLSALGFNTEEGCRKDVSIIQAENEYEFTRTELIECRRRTFWLGYMTEHYNGYCSGHLGLFSNKDIWVALPNRESDYQGGVASTGQLFNNGAFDASNSGSFTLLIAVGSMWGDITADNYRTIYRSKDGYLNHYTSFYDEMAGRLSAWETALPPHFRCSAENTRQNLEQELFVTYYVINACHLITRMKLNRYGHTKLLPDDVIRRNIRRARHYARLLLELVAAVAKSDRLPPNNRRQDLENAICQPFPGYAILGACDILSSRGITSALPEAQSLLGHARTVVSECARFFNSAKQQKKMIDSRLSELGATVAMKHSSRPTWKFKEPIEKSFIPQDMDLIYSADEEIYFGALEEEDAQLRRSSQGETLSSTASGTPVGLGLASPVWALQR